MKAEKESNEEAQQQETDQTPDYILLPGKYKYGPRHERDPFNPLKPRTR